MPRATLYNGRHFAHSRSDGHTAVEEMDAPVKLITIALAIPFLSSTAPAPAKSHLRYFRQYRGIPAKPHDTGGPAVVNGASFLPGVCPGGIAIITGQNLNNTGVETAANGTPLPDQLAGITVYVNGIAAPLYSITSSEGQDQISFQVPFETATGPGAAQIDVVSQDVTTGSVVADSFTADPGIFTNNGFAVAIHLDGSLVTPADPAYPGETITLYTTGLGPLTFDVSDGYPPPADALAYTVDPFQVLVNGEQCSVLFSGLAPGLVGVYQLNLTLPADLPFGDLDIQISTPNTTSAVAKLPVS
jgi:uncharacterized protein (TIGR03437 family)